MQSTVRSATSLGQNQTMQYLTDCLTEARLSESLDSQAETSERVPFLAGHSLMQQSRRMNQRPLALAGVQIAESNRFFVNLGNQTETCNRPTMFYEPLHQPGGDLPAMNQYSKSKASAATSNKTPWDFRAKSDFALDNACGQRDSDWPALDEESYRNPGPSQSVKVWSMASSSSRIPAQTVKAKKSAADAESLRELLDEAMEREAQRITARMKAFHPESENRSANEPLSVIAAVQTIFIRIQTQCQLLSGFAVWICCAYSHAVKSQTIDVR